MKMTKTALCSLLMLASIAAGAQTAPALSDADKAQRAACEMLRFADLSQVKDAPTRVSDVAVVEASGELPALCVVNGYVAPQVGFRLRLPLSTWNGKLMQLGTGGYAGSINTGDARWCEDAVRRGYACVQSDYGHTAGVTDKALASLDAVWAYNNPVQEIDYGYRAIHAVSSAMKAIAKTYYGKAQQQTYFMGCSNGGRLAMVAAQRYPWDFNGIVSMEPAINLNGAFITFLYNWRSVTDADGKPLLSPDDLQLLKKNAVAQCDGDDGAKDGVIGNPAACRVNLEPLRCAGDKDANCLSGKQIDAAKKVYAGPGSKYYRGRPMPGSEPGSFGFAVTRPLAELALKDFVRYLAFYPDGGPQYQLTDFNFDEDYTRLSTMEALYQSDNPDLRRFKEAGGKLLMVQGWEDGGTPFPLNSIDYYETMQRTMGGPKSTQDFARLFMAPGRSHCVGGDGASVLDSLSHLEQWVEQGKAPEMIRAYHIEPSDNFSDQVREPTDPAKIKFSRPLYPYPQQAKYKGSGDVNDWRNWKPVDISTIKAGK